MHFGLTPMALFRKHESKPWDPMIARTIVRVNREQLDDLLFGAIVGVILGGRLGYVLFYKPGRMPAPPPTAPSTRPWSARTGRSAP